MVPQPCCIGGALYLVPAAPQPRRNASSRHRNPAVASPCPAVSAGRCISSPRLRYHAAPQPRRNASSRHRNPAVTRPHGTAALLHSVPAALLHSVPAALLHSVPAALLYRRGAVSAGCRIGGVP